MDARLQDIFNIGKVLEFDGKQYTLKEASFDQKAEFATWVETRAYQACERMAKNIEGGEDAIAKAQAKVLGEMAAGKYEWGGEYVKQALMQRAGQRELVYILLRKDNPEIIPEMIDIMLDKNQEKINAKIQEIIDSPEGLAAVVSLLTTTK